MMFVPAAVVALWFAAEPSGEVPLGNGCLVVRLLRTRPSSLRMRQPGRTLVVPVQPMPSRRDVCGTRNRPSKSKICEQLAERRTQRRRQRLDGIKRGVRATRLDARHVCARKAAFLSKRLLRQARSHPQRTDAFSKAEAD